MLRIGIPRALQFYQGKEAITRIDDVRDMDALKRTKADILQKINQTPVDPTFRPVKIASVNAMFLAPD